MDDSILVELIDEGLAESSAGYWQRIDSALEASANDAAGANSQSGSVSQAMRRRFGPGPLLLAAAVVLIAALGALALRPTSDDSIDVRSGIATPEPVEVDEGNVIDDRSGGDAPADSQAVVVLDEATVSPEPTPAPQPTPTSVPEPTAQTIRTDEDILREMFFSVETNQDSDPFVDTDYSYVDAQHFFHLPALPGQIPGTTDESPRCVDLLRPRSDAVVLSEPQVASFRHEPGRTMVAAFDGPFHAESIERLYLDHASECWISPIPGEVERTIRPVADVMGADFGIAGFVIVDTWIGKQIVHLRHGRFIARVVGDVELSDSEVQSLVEEAAALLANAVDTPPPSGTTVMDDFDRDVGFGADPTWGAWCADGVLELLYADAAFFEIFGFDRDVRAGVYGPSNPPPADLDQRRQAAMIPDVDIVLPNPPSSFLKLWASTSFNSFERWTSAYEYSDDDYVEAFLVASQGYPWNASYERKATDSQDFAGLEDGHLTVIGEPCTTNASAATISMDFAMWREGSSEFENMPGKVRVRADEVTIDILNQQPDAN